MSLLYGVREIKSCSSEEEANELLAKKNWILLYVPRNPNDAHIFLLGRLDKPLQFRPISCEVSDIQQRL